MQEYLETFIAQVDHSDHWNGALYGPDLEPDRQTGTGPAGPVRSGPARSNFLDRPVFAGFLPVFF
jgi:hypothetical protein